jgi:hypothetical protein
MLYRSTYLDTIWMEEKMSAHTEASYESQYLCEKLFEMLLSRIPQLNRKQTKQWCALYDFGRNRFAYVSHRKRLSRIEVWCSGDVDELKKYSSIDVIPRDEIRGGWEEKFPARFVIDDESDIPAACDLLFNISYRAS